MSLVVNASGDYIRRTTNLPSATTFTLAAWYKRVAHVEDNQVILSVNSAGTFTVGMTQAVDLWRVQAGSSINSVSNGPALDTWYYLALTCAGTGATDTTFRIWSAAGTLIETLQATGQVQTVTSVQVLNSGFGQYTSGKAAYGRLWDAVLSQAELEAELASSTIVRTANINTAFGADSATDVSGNARDWATNAITVDSADNPSFAEAPVADRDIPGRRIYVLP